MGPPDHTESVPRRFLLAHANDIETTDPKTAHYCRRHAVDQAKRAKSFTKEESQAQDRLDLDKQTLTLDGETDRRNCEAVACQKFADADQADRAGRADNATADKFYASACLFEMLKQFSDLLPELTEKQNYALCRAAVIKEAVLSGRPVLLPAAGFAAASARSQAAALAQAAQHAKQQQVEVLPPPQRHHLVDSDSGSLQWDQRKAAAQGAGCVTSDFTPLSILAILPGAAWSSQTAPLSDIGGAASAVMYEQAAVNIPLVSQTAPQQQLRQPTEQQQDTAAAGAADHLSGGGAQFQRSSPQEFTPATPPQQPPVQPPPASPHPTLCALPALPLNAVAMHIPQVYEPQPLCSQSPPPPALQVTTPTSPPAASAAALTPTQDEELPVPLPPAVDLARELANNVEQQQLLP